MGLAAVGSETLFLATRYQIWRLENALPPDEVSEAGHDRLFLPQAAWTTGALHVRDLAVMGDGRVTFVNGLFSCLATPSPRLSFEPQWLPPFISDLAPEDRCHLSGVACEDGGPAFVTSASASNEPGGWRERVRDGGVVISVPGGELVATGLSMPCSPVLRDGRLWVCLGGSGELAAFDLKDGIHPRRGTAGVHSRAGSLWPSRVGWRLGTPSEARPSASFRWPVACPALRLSPAESS